MKKRRILMGKTHLIAGAVMLAGAGGRLRPLHRRKQKRTWWQMPTWTRSGTGTFRLLLRIMFGIP